MLIARWLQRYTLRYASVWSDRGVYNPEIERSVTIS